MGTDTPDIPALRIMSAERLTPGDVMWGVVVDTRKAWAYLNRPETVSSVHMPEGFPTVIVTMADPDMAPRALVRDDQVIIEHSKAATNGHRA